MLLVPATKFFKDLLKKPQTTKELHIVDLSDGTKWIIDDKIVVDLLKKYKSAPDQKTKDEIIKLLQSGVASSSTKVEAGQSHEICQVSKDRAGGGLDGNRLDSGKPTHGGLPAKNQKYQESKITKDLQNLKLDTDNKAGKEKEVDIWIQKEINDSINNVFRTLKICGLQ
ncbi:uncharacterized protein LOC120112446 [Phoenix dactylifera]|uniref:Uncharacterized protein LOC120112446 n=1 Tax=Phoenix dactylifera TaxID=42345 RepID=A0A8B9AVG6_PHODC|nr:uncharacterized protein LOC120112446 [Phoenix dactylifera]XP_038987824.1 uncharacterized protein LOC120112446 [Phoenix dactylifera]